MTTTEQARLLEKAKVGTAPDCANVDSFTIPLFIEQGVLQPLDKYFTPAQLRDLFPNVRKVMTGPRRPHLRVVVVDRPARPLPPHRPRPEGAADLGPADPVRAGGQEEGPEGRRLPVQRRALGSDHVRQPRLLLDAGREAARRQGRAGVRAGRQPRGDAQRLQARQAHDRQRRDAVARDHLQHLRRDGDRRAGRDRRDVPRRLVPVADDEGAARQGLRQVGGLRAPGTQAGRDRDRHRRLVGRRVQQGPGEGRGVHGHRALDLRRRGQRADRRAADVAEVLRHPQGLPAADLQAVPRVPQARAGAPRPLDLSVALERDAGRDRVRADRLLDARAGARQRRQAGRAELRAAEWRK